MPMEELLAMYGYGRESNEPKEVGTSNVATNETNINSEEETIGPTAQPMETDGGGGHTESVDNSDPDKSNSEQESVVPSQMAILLTGEFSRMNFILFWGKSIRCFTAGSSNSVQRSKSGL